MTDWVQSLKINNLEKTVKNLSTEVANINISGGPKIEADVNFNNFSIMNIKNIGLQSQADGDDYLINIDDNNNLLFNDLPVHQSISQTGSTITLNSGGGSFNYANMNNQTITNIGHLGNALSTPINIGIDTNTSSMTVENANLLLSEGKSIYLQSANGMGSLSGDSNAIIVNNGLRFHTDSNTLSSVSNKLQWAGNQIVDSSTIQALVEEYAPAEDLTNYMKKVADSDLTMGNNDIRCTNMAIVSTNGGQIAFNNNNSVNIWNSIKFQDDIKVVYSNSTSNGLKYGTDTVLTSGNYQQYITTGDGDIHMDTHYLTFGGNNTQPTDDEIQINYNTNEFLIHSNTQSNQLIIDNFEAMTLSIPQIVMKDTKFIDVSEIDFSTNNAGQRLPLTIDSNNALTFNGSVVHSGGNTSGVENPLTTQLYDKDSYGIVFGGSLVTPPNQFINNAQLDYNGGMIVFAPNPLTNICTSYNNLYIGTNYLTNDSHQESNIILDSSNDILLLSDYVNINCGNDCVVNCQNLNITSNVKITNSSGVSLDNSSIIVGNSSSLNHDVLNNVIYGVANQNQFDDATASNLLLFDAPQMRFRTSYYDNINTYSSYITYNAKVGLICSGAYINSGTDLEFTGVPDVQSIIGILTPNDDQEINSIGMFFNSSLGYYVPCWTPANRPLQEILTQTNPPLTSETLTANSQLLELGVIGNLNTTDNTETTIDTIQLKPNTHNLLKVSIIADDYCSDHKLLVRYKLNNLNDTDITILDNADIYLSDTHTVSFVSDYSNEQVKINVSGNDNNINWKSVHSFANSVALKLNTSLSYGSDVVYTAGDSVNILPIWTDRPTKNITYFISPALPNNLVINANTGEISGTA